MTLFELLNNVKIQGDLWVKVWDEEEEICSFCDFYQTMRFDDRRKYGEYQVTHIYPGRMENTITVELRQEKFSRLRVCRSCLMAIESREGSQATRKIYIDEDDPTPCDWCGEDLDDTLYEIL